MDKLVNKPCVGDAFKNDEGLLGEVVDTYINRSGDMFTVTVGNSTQTFKSSDSMKDIDNTWIIRPSVESVKEKLHSICISINTAIEHMENKRHMNALFILSGESRKLIRVINYFNFQI